MKISTILAIPLAWLLINCGEDLKLERRTVTFPNGKGVKEDWTFVRQPNGDTLEHGVHKKFFWNGNPGESVIWKMGKRDGSSQAWYDNGGVKWEKNFDAGLKQGTWRLFFPGGHPWIVAHFEKNIMTGTLEVWHKADATESKKAEFANGVCTSGDCNLMDEPLLAEDAPEGEKVEQTRAWALIREFLE